MFRSASILTLLLSIAFVTPSCSRGGGGSGGGGGGVTPPPPAPNSAPEVTLVSPVGVVAGDVSFSVTIVDVDDDTVTVDLEYSLDGGATFFPVSLAAGSAPIVGLFADADGESYTFVWDSLIDQVGRLSRVSGVVIRVTAADGATGIPVVGSGFDVDNVTPTAPMVSAVSPLLGPAGTLIVIEGFNFGSDVTAFVVRVGANTLRAVSLTEGAMTPSGVEGTYTCVTSPELETGLFEVAFFGNVLWSGGPFEVAPRLSRISNSVVVLPGSMLTLTGERLASVDQVEFEVSGEPPVLVGPVSAIETAVEVSVPALTIPTGGAVVTVRALTAGVSSNPIGFFYSSVSPPQTPPSLTALELPLRSSAARIPVRFRLFDSGSTDQGEVIVSFSTDGGPFAPCTEGSSSALTGAVVPASPFGQGIAYEFDWDAATDLGTDFSRQVRLRVETVAQGGEAGPTWISAPFWVGGAPETTWLETFDSNDFEDPSSTADWNGATPGELVGTVAGTVPWGTGADGEFAPVSGTVTLITDGLDPTFGGFGGVFNFTDINIPSGVTVLVSGSNPLVLRATGSVTIDGTVEVSGGAGSSASLTAAGGGGGATAGGTAGGSGGTVISGFPVDGESALHGGHGGLTTLSLQTAARGGGGGGGGMVSAGDDGQMTPGIGSGRGGIGGIPRGPADLLDPQSSGVGGGGGGGGVDPTGGAFGRGGGGGGGGGTVHVIAQDIVTMSGRIMADGGSGGSGLNAGGGGGGSGGQIVVESATDIIFASGVQLSANGGNGGAGDAAGGDGSDGRVVLESPNTITLPTTGGGAPGSSFDFSGVIPGPGSAGFSQGTVDVTTIDFGAGIDGAFAPTSSVTLMTDGTDPVFGGSNGVFEFTTIDIPAGVVITAIGSRPLVFKATGDATIEGSFDLSGQDALPLPFAPPPGGMPGAGGAGGGSGGSGGFFVAGSPAMVLAGEDGALPFGVILGAAGGGALTNPTPDGSSVSGAGGGGGFAEVGLVGETGFGPAGTPGGVAGSTLGAADFRDPLDLTQVVIHGGSGGGGGGGSAQELSFPPGVTMPGAGGGGGGGGLWVAVQGTLTVTATAIFDLTGGNGTDNTNPFAGAGGAGAGGGLLISAGSIDLGAAVVMAIGGTGGVGAGSATAGGDGAPGRIRFETSDAVGGGPTGTIEPAAVVRVFSDTTDLSIGQSLPIPLVGDEGFPTFGGGLDAFQAQPAIQTTPAEVRILWGVWQADPSDPTVPREFTGFTENLGALPAGEFLQFKIFLESGLVPLTPARIDSLEAQLTP